MREKTGSANGTSAPPAERWVDLLVLLGCFAFLLSYFKPEYLFSISTTTGGDTASHYYTAFYAAHHLMPQGRVLGWLPGNLGGFPLFQFYFPLPFLAMGALSWLMPLEVAFKLVSACGAFLLPLCAWAGLRLAGLAFPAPALGAVFTLPFLFNETQAMWGGNIPSLLAGEMGYSMGMALLVLYLGGLHQDIDQRKHMVRNGLVLAAVGLCHGCTLLFGVVAGVLWLFSRRLATRALYLFAVYTLAFCLMGFWIVPLLFFSEYNTLHNMVWDINQWQKVVPPPIIPLMALALAHAAWAAWRRIPGPQGLGTTKLFAGLTGLSLVLYLVAFHLNVIDIRFFPFAWLSICLWAAAALGSWCRGLSARPLVPVVVLVAAVVGISWHVTYIPNWIKWNYKGFEARPAWHEFAQLNDYLKGGPGDPRVLHEHNDVHNRLGTTRAFENLPLFSGRNTMEGLYIQSSVNSPFIFYLQSLTSLQPTTPLPGYNYSRFDLARAIPRMILFNVRDFVVVSDKTRQAALAQPGLLRMVDIGPYTIFRVKDNPGTYAVPLKYKPVLVITKRWKELAFEWFRRGDLEVPLVFKKSLEPGEEKRFAAVWHDKLGAAPRQELPDPGPIKEEASFESLKVLNPSKAPLLIKNSYHPNWQVRGADKVYLATPAFMLVFPDREEVVLEFGQSWPNFLGQALFGLALLALLLNLPGLAGTGWALAIKSRSLAPLDKTAQALERLLAKPVAFCQRHALILSVAGILALAIALGLYLHGGGKEDAAVAHRKAREALQAKDYIRAEKMFRRALERWPRSQIVDHTALNWGFSFYLRKQYGQAMAAFKDLIARYPESPNAAEAWYHIGLCQRNLGRKAEAAATFTRLSNEFPDSKWAGFAKDRLREIKK